VNVSIVNWVKRPAEPPERAVLDGADVPGITPALRVEGADVTQAARLAANRGHAFQGPIPVGEGFVLSTEEAMSLRQRGEADYSSVVRPYLIGEDIAEDPRQEPRRYVIDFAAMPLEEASRYPAALAIVRERVKPGRDKNQRRARRERWWRFGEAAVGMRKATAPLGRYIAGLAQGKRIFFCWCSADVCPSNLTNVFAFDDDYALGVLTSVIHGEWARAHSSTLRVDVRYTPTSAFETFPWPARGNPRREEIGSFAATIVARRLAICSDRSFGLTALYNEVDDGAYSDLADLHGALDRAVAVAYGWPASAADDPDDSNARLLELNRAIHAGAEYSPF
jgi:hypothetical protein